MRIYHGLRNSRLLHDGVLEGGRVVEYTVIGDES